MSLTGKNSGAIILKEGLFPQKLLQKQTAEKLELVGGQRVDRAGGPVARSTDTWTWGTGSRKRRKGPPHCDWPSQPGLLDPAGG